VWKESWLRVVWLSYFCRVGRLDDLLVFHQSFVTQEPVNFIACVELCLLCYDFWIRPTLYSTWCCMILTVWTIILSQKSNTFTYSGALIAVSHYQYIFQTCGSTATDLLVVLFTQHKTTRGLPLSAVSLSLCITCQDVCVQQSHAGLSFSDFK